SALIHCLGDTIITFPVDLTTPSGCSSSLFTAEELQAIRSTTFHDVITAVTSAEAEDIQRRVFFWKDGDPCPQPSQVTASELHPCTNATKLNYFDDGSKAGFGILVICLFLFPVGQYLMLTNRNPHAHFTLGYFDSLIQSDL
uniref:Uncharacterized protein n=1 Tax=Hucho hucho TaxID=62062 RepID=A0A4W5KEV4_9TELE